MISVKLTTIDASRTRDDGTKERLYNSIILLDNVPIMNGYNVLGFVSVVKRGTWLESIRRAQNAAATDIYAGACGGEGYIAFHPKLWAHLKDYWLQFNEERLILALYSMRGHYASMHRRYMEFAINTMRAGDRINAEAWHDKAKQARIEYRNIQAEIEQHDAV